MVAFDQIDEAYLNRLIETRTPESKHLEYKQATYEKSDAAQAEWLADISSFANTDGGLIIIGMKAESGVAAKIEPLTINPDDEITRLENIAGAGLQPRIHGLTIQAVTTSSGNIIAVKIPRSYRAPHRVIKRDKGQNRFWARHATGKYEPDVDELRTLFAFVPQLADRIRDFRADRLAKISAGIAPIALSTREKLVIHVIPFVSFARQSSTSLDLKRVSELTEEFKPIRSSSGRDHFANLDGILFHSTENRNEAQRAYTQISRNGMIEAVQASIMSGDPQVPQDQFTNSWIIHNAALQATLKYCTGLARLGIDGPYAILVSLVGVKDRFMTELLKEAWNGWELVRLTQDQLNFNEVIVDELPTTIPEAATILRPLFDQVANAAGKLSSQHFDENGTYELNFRF